MKGPLATATGYRSPRPSPPSFPRKRESIPPVGPPLVGARSPVGASRDSPSPLWRAPKPPYLREGLRAGTRQGGASEGHGGGVRSRSRSPQRRPRTLPPRPAVPVVDAGGEGPAVAIVGTVGLESQAAGGIWLLTR